MSQYPYTLSLLIVSFNTRALLRRCLASAGAASAALAVQVIVVDNASHDGSADMVAQEFPAVLLLRSRVNLGFAAANNRALERASGRYAVLLNPDAELAPDALRLALRFMDQQPAAALAGGRLFDPQGRDQPSARCFPSLLNELLTLSGLAARYPRSRLCGRFDRTWADPATPAEVDWVPGAFAIIRSSALRAVGAFDERFFLYYEEVDLCRRLRRAGWQVWYRPEVEVRHLGGASAASLPQLERSADGAQLTLWRMRSALLYYRKHHGRLGASLLAGLEGGWHCLRQLKAHCAQADARRAAKLAESGRLRQLMQRAWQDTAGGTRCPARPW